MPRPPRDQMTENKAKWPYSSFPNNTTQIWSKYSFFSKYFNPGGVGGEGHVHFLSRYETIWWWKQGKGGYFIGNHRVYTVPRWRPYISTDLLAKPLNMLGTCRLDFIKYFGLGQGHNWANITGKKQEVYPFFPPVKASYTGSFFFIKSPKKRQNLKQPTTSAF